MDFERGYDVVPQKPPEEAAPIERKLRKDSSYSEEEQAKVIEGSLTDIKNPKKRQPLETVSRQEKIIVAYKKITDQILNTMQEMSKLGSNNMRQEDLLLDDIKELRKRQDELLHMLMLEQRGELREGSVSAQAWKLIQ